MAELLAEALNPPASRGRALLLSCALGALLLVPSGSASAQARRKPSADDLVRAIQLGNLTRAKKLMDAGIDLSRPDRYGDTPLNAAILGLHADLALEIIRKGADVNLRPGVLSAPLAAAASVCQVEVMTYLLDRGAKVDAREADGDTALMLAAGDCRDGEAVKTLLKAGADPNAADRVGCTPLISAADEGNERVVEILIAAGADLNAMTTDGKTALQVAQDHPFQKDGHKRVCALLLKAGAKE